MEALSEPEDFAGKPPLLQHNSPLESTSPRVVDCEKVSSSFSLDSQGSGVEEGPEEGGWKRGSRG